jgi:hypothetical protein
LRAFCAPPTVRVFECVAKLVEVHLLRFNCFGIGPLLSKIKKYAFDVPECHDYSDRHEEIKKMSEVGHKNESVKVLFGSREDQAN